MRYFLIFSVILIATSCNDVRYLQNIPVTEPDRATLADGVYIGQYRLKLPFGSWVANSEAEVTVTVSNHRYIAIEITGLMKPGIKPYMRPILNDMLSNQSIALDAVTSGSYTKRAVQKAAEAALSKPPVR